MEDKSVRKGIFVIKIFACFTLLLSIAVFPAITMLINTYEVDSRSLVVVIAMYILGYGVPSSTLLLGVCFIVQHCLTPKGKLFEKRVTRVVAASLFTVVVTVVAFIASVMLVYTVAISTLN